MLKEAVVWAAIVAAAYAAPTMDGFAEKITLPEFPKHSIRLSSESTSGNVFCEDTTKHYYGYLDVVGGTGISSLFFIFYEARSNPDTAPLALWTNGGPGASSTDGFLNENGACQMADDGSKSSKNPYAFNEAANYIWLDHPASVGYSYGPALTPNSDSDAETIYAFFQLFLHKFSEFKDRDLHLTGESYGGTYIPHIASSIIDHNAALQKGLVHLPLKSIWIGNGIYDARTQFLDRYNYTCESSYAFLDKDTCSEYKSSSYDDFLNTKSVCDACYKALDGDFSKYFSTAPCVACEELVSQPTGDHNPYDIRVICPEDKINQGDYCYPFWNNINKFTDRKDVKKVLNVPDFVSFQDVSTLTNLLFVFASDEAIGSYRLIPKIVNAGVRFGSLVGDQDTVCDWIGNLDWQSNLDWRRKAEFDAASFVDVKGSDGQVHAQAKAIGPGAGDFVFLKVYESGHLIPHDQPQFSLDLLKKWFADEPFA